MKALNHNFDRSMVTAMYEPQINAALSSKDPASALVSVAQELSREGQPAHDIYAAFSESHEIYSRAHADRHLAACLRSVMDRMTGWCNAALRLFPPLADPSEPHLTSRFVVPFYLLILHGNYSSDGFVRERDEFVREAKDARKFINEAVIDWLLEAQDWRPRISGAWFCGVMKWRKYIAEIGKLLIASRYGFAGQAYCFAMACFADEASAAYLCKYLDTYLVQPEKEYDQAWAMPALMWIDRVTGTSHAEAYLKPGGLWEGYIKDGAEAVQVLDQCWNRFERLMNMTAEYFW